MKEKPVVEFDEKGHEKRKKWRKIEGDMMIFVRWVSDITELLKPDEIRN